MRVILTGSGPATGFPVPGCPCATCAQAHPALRTSPAQPPPAPPAPFPRAPARLDLPGGHHLDAAGALHAPTGPVDLPSATPVALTPGLTAESLPGGVLITTPAATVLWSPAPTTFESLRGRELTTAYLGPPATPTAPATPAGPATPATPAGPASSRQLLGRVIARLRAVGAVTDATEVAVIALGHEVERTTLPLVLRAWGAHEPPDGSEPGPALPRVAGRFVVLGGSGSGKSELAEDLLSAEPEVVYLATGPVPTPGDPEWARRVERHRARRPAGWTTEDCEPGALPARLAKEDRPILLDSVGSWLTAALDRAGAWDDRPGWRDELSALTSELTSAWRSRRAPLVAVTEEVGWSVVAPTSAGRLFTTELGRLNQRLAAESEHLLVVVAGRVMAPLA